MKKLVLFSVVLFVPALLFAQTDTSNVSLQEVIIRGDRFAGTPDEQNADIQIITRKDIQKLPVTNVNELLMMINGVDMRRRGPNGAQADIVIDGSTFDQVLVMVNGVKMSDPQTGHHLMNIPVPLESIDHIEVIRGAAGRTYGLNALAGAVNIVTRVPLSNTAFAGTIGGSSFEKDTATGDTYYHWGVHGGASIRKDKHGHLLSLSHDRSNGYRYNTGFTNSKVFYQNDISLGKHLIEMQGGYVHNAFGANAFYAAPGDKESEETVQTAFGAVAANLKVSEKFTLKPRVSFRYGNDDYIYIRQKPSVFRNLHETNVVNAGVNGVYVSGNHSFGIGAEWRNENIRSSNLGFRTRDLAGIFAEYKVVLGKFSAGAGVYGSYISRIGSDSTDAGFDIFPGADVGYVINKNIKLFASAGTGQRIPTYTDLYYDGPSNIGNANLLPEKGLTAEAGVRIRKKCLHIDGSVAIKSISEFIDYTRADVNDEWQPNNFQTLQTTLYNIRYTWLPSDQFKWKSSMSISSGYTYLEPSIDASNAFESKYAVEALRHQWISSFSYAVGNFSMNAVAKYQYRINGNDYTILDARVAYKIADFTVFADINNILDTQYREIASVPLPGRWVSAGLKWRVVK